MWPVYRPPPPPPLKKGRRRGICDSPSLIVYGNNFAIFPEARGGGAVHRLERVGWEKGIYI